MKLIIINNLLKEVRILLEESASGLKIEMYIDNNGEIISAFPKY